MGDKITKSPNIRFKGFTEAWEQRKLGDIVQITMGQSPDGSTYSDTPNGYILVQGNADLKNGWVTPRIWTSQITKKAEAGDLIMSVRAPAGEMGKTAYNAVIGRGVAAIKGNEFIFQNLVKMNGDGYWKKLSCGSTFESLNSDNIKNAKIMISNLDEQVQIGVFFKNLDNLITLHQRKLDLLKVTKKSMLQKMFPKDGESVPEIRFAGFTDAWEQRELEYFVDDYLEKTTVQNQYPVLTSSQKQGIVLQEEYFANRQVTTEKNIGYFILPRGYFTFRSRTDNGIFAFNRNDIVDYGIISYFYPVFSIKNGDSNFFLQFLNYSIRRDVDLAAEGTGQRVLSLKKFKGIKIVVPTIDEQQKIGEYFYNLDNLITLHQRELDLLKDLKKSMLQQMFI
ncbi:restriction endonuclease subunit S [Clostridium botulinum C]|uniref:restriction endonuclease subunit S n=1 Tax=Clostridium botulinum TaxID=1491 RepID=UPI001E6423F0|nr:restriction endonuclease subunit S [Clostridium botulinum]MCD3217722.1 restriction endonuclease subunit S [Clostridium botulinum C]